MIPQDRRPFEREDSEDSPACAQCDALSGPRQQQQRQRCPHCELSETDEGDLICFSCHQAEHVGNSCCCGNRTGAVSTTDDDDSCTTTATTVKYREQIDSNVRIHLNNRSLEEESDETTTTTTTTTSGEIEAAALPLAERLATIVEAKGDTTASENDDEAPKRLNGNSSQTRFLNYMVVLFM